MSPSVRILLVDDHALLRRGMRGYIEREIPGASIAEAESAEAAYSCLEKEPAALIMMDLHLPGDDGITATEKIRKSSPETKVIIVSGQSGREELRNDLRRALQAGVSGFISKSDGDIFIVHAIEAARKGQVFLSPIPCTELARSLRQESAVAEEKGQLSPQELTVLKRLAEGASYKDISDEMGVGVKTVDTYRTRLTKKLNLGSREDLQAAAKRFGLTA